MYGRLIAGKVAALEEAVARGDDGGAATAAAGLQRATAFVCERHATIGAALRHRRAAALAALLAAWQQWAALESRDVLAAAATTQRTVDSLASLRSAVVVPPAVADDWLADIADGKK